MKTKLIRWIGLPLLALATLGLSACFEEHYTPAGYGPYAYNQGYAYGPEYAYGGYAPGYRYAPPPRHHWWRPWHHRERGESEAHERWEHEHGMR